MTAQATENITIDGVLHTLYSLPFDSYIESLNPKPALRFMSTACWRGYIGEWNIHDRKLYLTKILAQIVNDSGSNEVSLDYFFPDSNDEVFAEWFSGILRIPLSGKSEYHHGGYGHTYDNFMHIEILKGEQISISIVDENLLRAERQQAKTVQSNIEKDKAFVKIVKKFFAKFLK